MPLHEPSVHDRERTRERRSSLFVAASRRRLKDRSPASPINASPSLQRSDYDGIIPRNIKEFLVRSFPIITPVPYINDRDTIVTDPPRSTRCRPRRAVGLKRVI